MTDLRTRIARTIEQNIHPHTTNHNPCQHCLNIADQIIQQLQ